jgi:hypothetical protein
MFIERYHEILGHIGHEAYYVKDGDTKHLVWSETSTHWICDNNKLLFEKDTVEIFTQSVLY